ncbi:MAG: hypothetical protein Q8M15_17020 [Bacteroidota bacterium]|nr:hypothetical protein [Bacteroidota bacterium]
MKTQIFEKFITINCDIIPEIPEVMYVKNHQKRGLIEWPPNDGMKLLQPNDKPTNGLVDGEDICKHISNLKLNVLNACVLDFLIINQKLIPKNWKKKIQGESIRIFFPGTIFRNTVGHTFIRYIFFDKKGKWQKCSFETGSLWTKRDHLIVVN